MKTNRKTKAAPHTAKNVSKTTHEGAASITYLQTPIHQLRRLVLANMLFEDQFYIDGKTTADLVKDMAYRVSTDDLGDLAIEARHKFNLRHVPLLLAAVLVDRARAATADEQTKRRAKIVVGTVVARPDEMGELISLYRKTFKMNGKMKLPSILKRGLAEAFVKFDNFQLAKYANRPADISLRDVMFLVHPKPSPEREAFFKQIAEKTTVAPPTWEVLLSAGKDKRETFTQLLADKKIGGLAFLRNLRNISDSGVPRDVVRKAFETAEKSMSRVLPFRFLTAAKYAPDYRQEIQDLFLRSMANRKKLKGTTLIVVDVSGSMHSGMMSGKSEMNRQGAASALAAIARELCDDVKLVVTGNTSVEVRSTLRGLDMAERLHEGNEARAAGGGGIYTHRVMRWCKERFNGIHFDRVIIVTDEQDCGGHSESPATAPTIGKFNYMLNVGAYQSGVAHNKWLTISGFSDAVFDYIAAVEEMFDVE